PQGARSHRPSPARDRSAGRGQDLPEPTGHDHLVPLPEALWVHGQGPFTRASLVQVDGWVPGLEGEADRRGGPSEGPLVHRRLEKREASRLRGRTQAGRDVRHPGQMARDDLESTLGGSRLGPVVEAREAPERDEEADDLLLSGLEAAADAVMRNAAQAL